MGKPAARMGDMTVHGGSIVAGFPTVLIGGQPAARLGDMHVCPMLNPGVPPPPHVGGPIAMSSCPTVLIGGQPAACVGDMATCAGPPDTIAPPGCPTVLIGSGGGGGGAGAGGGSGGGEAASATADSGSATGEAAEGEEEEDHFLKVKITDKGGFPITGVGYKVTAPDGKTTKGILTGGIRRTGIEPGNYEIALQTISTAKWSVDQAQVGETVTLTAKCAGIESGTKATLTIYIRDYNSTDRILAELHSPVSGDEISTDWEFTIDDALLEIQKGQEQRSGYSAPRAYFVVEADGCTARSGFLWYRDWMEIKLNNEKGEAVADTPYKVFFPNGEVRSGTLDSNGKARLENIPPGRARVTFDSSR